MKLRISAALALAGALAISAYAGPSPDGATIVNSGSTNAAGWSIALRSDARGTLSATGGATRAFRATPALTATFFHDLAAARAARLPNVQTCMKSASFGSATVAHWHGWQSPDFGCPQHAGLGQALARDVTGIEAAAGVPALALRHRVYPVPNEPRRTEPTQTPRQGP